MRTGLIGFFVLLLFPTLKSTWWLPESSNDNWRSYCEIKMRIYDRCDADRYMEFCIEESISLFYSPLYDKNNCNTVIIGLPFLNSISHPNVQRIIRAVASKCRYNIIVMDNSKHTKTDNPFSYPLTMYTDHKDSERYAKALNDAIGAGLLRGDCVVAIGFSLGAQAVGQVCRRLIEKCNQLYAIDPAGPFYLPTTIPIHIGAMQLVSRTDACRVVTLECNRYLLGTPFSTAHVNIIVNNGLHQPSCPLVSFPCSVLCSHMFCNLLFASALSRPGMCVATSGDNPNDLFYLEFPSDERWCEHENTQEQVFYLDTTEENGGCLERGRPRNILVNGGDIPLICKYLP